MIVCIELSPQKPGEASTSLEAQLMLRKAYLMSLRCSISNTSGKRTTEQMVYVIILDIRRRQRDTTVEESGLSI